MFSNLVEELSSTLLDKGLTIATAESCTGGMIAVAITSCSGSSSIFNEGAVTYSNEAKVKRLGIQEETLLKYGAVSAQTAEQMAEGMRKAAQADIGVSVTGIAGPTGGTEQKPVGTVYIGLSAQDMIISHHYQFQGNREDVRNQTVVQALKHAIEVVTNA